ELPRCGSKRGCRTTNKDRETRMGRYFGWLVAAGGLLVALCAAWAAYAPRLPSSATRSARAADWPCPSEQRGGPALVPILLLPGHREPPFVQQHPVATKRALRAILKAADLCAQEPERAARVLVDRKSTPRFDYAAGAPGDPA